MKVKQTFTHAHVIYSLPSQSHDSSRTLWFRACQRVCMCSVYMCRLDSMCVFWRPLSCAGKRGGGGTSLQQPRSFDPSISSSHLSVYEIHREQRGRPRWQMHSTYRKTVTVCRVAGRKRSYRLIRLASRWANRQKSVHAATGTCSFFAPQIDVHKDRQAEWQIAWGQQTAGQMHDGAADLG